MHWDTLHSDFLYSQPVRWWLFLTALNL